MNRIIIEGITGSGKTTLVKLIKKKLCEDDQINLFSISQFYTSTLIYKNRGIDAELKTYNILDNICTLLENFENEYNEYGSIDDTRRFNSLIECFHFEIFAKKYLSDWKLFKSIDTRMNKLGFKIVILYLPEDKIIYNSIISTIKYRNSIKWSNYLHTLGNNDDEIKQYFVNVQNNLLAFAEETMMPVHIISTEKMNWKQYFDEIISFSAN